MATSEVTQIILLDPKTTFSQSPTISALAAALAKAQGEFEVVKKDSDNPFFKSSYADLASVLAATRPSLSKNGLAVIQSPKSGLFEGSRCVVVSTMLVHSSGEWICDQLAVPVDKAFTAQSVGSAVTYARRYALQAFLGVAGEDDDGNAASGKKVEARPHSDETNEEFDQRTEGQQCIAVFQIQAIDEACKRTGKTEPEILAYLNLIGHKRIEHILKSQFQEFLKWANTPTNGKPKPDVKPASRLPLPKVDQRDKAMRRLWAAAAEFSIPEKDVKTCAYEKFKVDSMKDLSEGQLDEMTDWVRQVAAAVAES